MGRVELKQPYNNMSDVVHGILLDPTGIINYDVGNVTLQAIAVLQGSINCHCYSK